MEPLVAVWNEQYGVYFPSKLQDAQVSHSNRALETWTLRALHQLQTLQPQFWTIAMDMEDTPLDLAESLTQGLAQLGVTDIAAHMSAALHSTVHD